MTMKYKKRCVCQLVDAQDSFVFRYGKCIFCDGVGESEFSLYLYPESDKIDKSKFFPVKFYSETPDESVDATLTYDDIQISIKCSCGDDVYFGDMENFVVCTCGRVYLINVDISKDDTHLGDMEYWDKIKKERYEK